MWIFEGLFVKKIINFSGSTNSRDYSYLLIIILCQGRYSHSNFPCFSSHFHFCLELSWKYSFSLILLFPMFFVAAGFLSPIETILPLKLWGILLPSCLVRLLKVKTCLLKYLFSWTHTLNRKGENHLELKPDVHIEDNFQTIEFHLIAFSILNDHSWAKPSSFLLFFRVVSGNCSLLHKFFLVVMYFFYLFLLISLILIWFRLSESFSFSLDLDLFPSYFLWYLDIFH